MRDTRIIGLTGGIGAGKSFIAKGLRNIGYEVYDSDAAAQRLIHDNLCVRSQIELLFGSDIFVNDCYDKQRVSALVFNNPELLEKLNQIVHPAVAYDLQEWAHNSAERVVFVEAAILFESGFNKLCQAIVCVVAPNEVRIERVMARDHTTMQAVEERLKNQLDQDWIKEHSDLVINNDGNKSVQLLCEEIRDFVEKLEE